MFLARIAVDVCQLVLHQAATAQPNKSPQEGRYKAMGGAIFGFNPLILWFRRVLLYSTCALEFLTVAHYYIQSSRDPSELTPSIFCPSFSRTGEMPHLTITPITCLGLALVALGAYFRLRSYAALGSLFTFDLCIKPEHRLVTEGPYGLVRHPAYLGLFCLAAGLPFVTLTRGSWVTECGVGPDQPGAMFAVHCLWISWWVWVAGFGYVRAIAEDEKMRKEFGKEWEQYAVKVRYWFVPGLV